MLFDRNPRWYAALTNAIPDSKISAHQHIENTVKLIKIPRSFKKKLNGSALTENYRSITSAPGYTAFTNNNLRLSFQTGVSGPTLMAVA